MKLLGPTCVRDNVAPSTTSDNVTFEEYPLYAIMTDNALLLSRAESYAHSKGIKILRKDMLGYGSDGNVWQSSARSAIKALNRGESYAVELECYRRLKTADVIEICGFNVPVLEGWDDELMIIEMSIVQPPYLLDFGKVYLDEPPTYLYDEQMIANATEEWRERFGDRWTKINSAVGFLRKFGIYYYDPRPGNICFGDEDDDVL